MRRHWVVSVEHTSVLRRAKSQKNIQSLLSLRIFNIWCSISSHACHFCSSALINILSTHESWCQHLERKNILSTIFMTKVDCILVVDVASLSLLAQCCCCCAPEPSPRRQLLGRLLSAFPNAQIEQLHHCMLFSLQHLQFVIQWSSSLHTEHSYCSRTDQDKRTQIS